MNTKIILVSIAILLSGCASQGQHYHNMNYEESYDPIVYIPQDTVKPFYDHTYYRYDARERYE